MKISYNWLKEYIDIDNSPEELAEIMTNIGLEVSDIEMFSSVKGGLEGFVIGEVTECEKHPDADKLSVTKVNIGEKTELDIVCGAPNVAKGQKVLVATVGTKLYNNKEEFLIKKVKIRGQVSEGMICAEDEAGLGTSHDGIMVLDQSAKPGTPAAEYFNVEKDIIFEIDLTPNRIDAASHLGVARDIAAWKNLAEDFGYNKPDVSKFRTNTGNKCGIKIIVENTEACPRYMGICISNVKVERSPAWLENKLKAIGINPTNNIVDITNYILHETGQPLHAFDKDKIKGNKVIVKTLPENTKFITLDEEERKLTKNDLMICNEEEGMCIAGVLGGTSSGVNENTKNIFIESAYFNPSWIRKTAKYHGISTDASFRFERGADIEMLPYAIKRAAILMSEIAGGEICSDLQDVYPQKAEMKKVNFSYSKCFKAIGKNIGKEKVDRIIKALEIEISEEKGDNAILFIPPYRVDAYRQADIEEEILRIYGYNNIEIPQKIVISVKPAPKPDNEKISGKISGFLTGAGFTEIMCNSLIKDSYQDFATEPDIKTVKLHNPLSRDLNIMRFTMLFGGLESIAYNINRKNPDLKFFEFGRIYSQLRENNSSDINNYFEKTKCALWTTGKHHQLHWDQKEEETGFFKLKGYCERILELFSMDFQNLKKEKQKNAMLNYCLNYFIDDKIVLTIGEASKKVLKITDIEQAVYFAEFDWDFLINSIKNKSIKYEAVSRFPVVKRDLSIMINKNITYEELRKTAFETEPNYLTEVQLFDVYSGKGIDENKISYALSFTLEDKSKTMTDKQIDKIMQRIIKSYADKFNAVLR